MRTDDFDYPLPASRVAQRPAPRGTSRLLVLDAPPDDRRARHRTVADLPSLLRPGDLVVVNDTRVIPARLLGRRLPGGGQAELLLLEPVDDAGRRWRALLRPAKRLRPGSELVFGGGRDRLGATVAERGAEGRGEIVFERDPRPELERLGQVPLPPYVERPSTGPDAADRDDYQTVFARVPGAVAAPTAGLHFDRPLLAALEARGVARAAVTLHVGPGTFQPVTAERIDDHRMAGERYEVPAATAAAIAEARRRGGRVVAVGTTVVRTLETAARSAETTAREPVAAGAGVAELFIRPGFRFRAVDVLLTNFHLPRSTLLMLTSAFAGRERVLAAYAEAIREGYRFYSYGDAMLLERRPPRARGRPG